MGWFAKIENDLAVYGGNFGCQGFWAMAVYRFGRWRYGIGSRFIRRPFSLLYKILYKFVQILTGIELPCEVPVGRNFRIDHFGGIIVSGYASFGDDCIIRNGVTVGLKNLDVKRAPRIGNRVNIGAGARILGDITIGDNVDIGANAVVIRSVPDNSIAVGIPARIIPKKEERRSVSGKINTVGMPKDHFKKGENTMNRENRREEELPHIDCVVIGVNAESTLKECLDSIKRCDYPSGKIHIVYVDGGSSDRSLEVAGGVAGVRVVSLALAHPTPGRGRNAGWRSGRAELVQFLDSDTELSADWFRKAVPELTGNVGAVRGYRREKNPEGSVFNWIADLEWNAPVGEADSFGGDVLVKREALVGTGGYDEELVGGEDPELSLRFRAAGYGILQLDALMTRHDLAMTGEITLRGRVLPIGGLREKLLAAHRGLSKTVLIPIDNKKDLKDVPEAILKDLEIIPVENMDEVLSCALDSLSAEELFRGRDSASPIALNLIKEEYQAQSH